MKYANNDAPFSQQYQNYSVFFPEMMKQLDGYIWYAIAIVKRLENYFIIITVIITEVTPDQANPYLTHIHTYLKW